MLSLLSIENVAVIEKTEIEFGSGFNVLTGETGAGKSIIIDSINLILGERTSRELIRNGAEFAVVTAVFDDIGTTCTQLLKEEEISCEDGQLFLYRKITTDGKSICKINSNPVSAAILRKVGALLVDIHGQHDAISLMDTGRHRKYLDDYSGCGELLCKYKSLYSEYSSILKQLKELEMDEEAKQRQLEILRFQIDEIENASLKIGELEELTERKAFFSNIEKITSGAESAYSALKGTNGSAIDLLELASKNLIRTTSYDKKLEELSERLSDSLYSVKDIAEELYSYINNLDYSKAEQDIVESRLDVIYKLRRKYGNTIQDILDFLKHAKNQYDQIEFSEKTAAKLYAQKAEVYKQLIDTANELYEIRVKNAEKLGSKIASEIAQMNMPNVRFSCSVTRESEGEEIKLTSDGLDSVEFLVSTNPGEPLKPISKVASGGELSRIMLGIKNVLAKDDIDTMIFDEVDSGISGNTAHKVGEKLKAVSKTKQVLCVTHLAQIAAMADSHFLIEKHQTQTATHTTVKLLDRQNREREIARILGGAQVTDATIKNASELIDMAKKY